MQRSTRRQRGHAVTELVFSFVMLGLGCLAIDAMTVSQDLRTTNETTEQLARALAEGQRDRIDALPYEELLPTEGFEPASWVRHPGLEAGQVAIETGTGRRAHSQLFTVQVQIQDADEWGSMRRFAVVVEWEQPNQTIGRVETKGLRAGLHPGYASRGVESRIARSGERGDARGSVL